MSFSTSLSGAIGLNVKIHVKSERREEFLKVIAEDATGSLEEPNCMQFSLGESTSAPNVFHIHEQYKSKAALEHHRSCPHFAAVGEFLSTDSLDAGGMEVVEFALCNDEGKSIPPRDAFCLSVSLFIKPEHRDEFFKVIDINQSGTRTNEQLALQYDWGESLEEPNSFYFHEEYKGGDGGKEGFEAHAKAPHFGVWEKFVDDRDPFSRPPVVDFFKTSSA